VANSAIARIVKSVIQIAITRCLVQNVQVLQLREIAELRWNSASQIIAVEIPDSDELSNRKNSQLCRSNCNHKMSGQECTGIEAARDCPAGVEWCQSDHCCGDS